MAIYDPYQGLGQNSANLTSAGNAVGGLVGSVTNTMQNAQDQKKNQELKKAFFDQSARDIKRDLGITEDKLPRIATNDKQTVQEYKAEVAGEFGKLMISFFNGKSKSELDDLLNSPNGKKYGVVLRKLVMGKTTEAVPSGQLRAPGQDPMIGPQVGTPPVAPGTLGNPQKAPIAPEVNNAISALQQPSSAASNAGAMGMQLPTTQPQTPSLPGTPTPSAVGTGTTLPSPAPAVTPGVPVSTSSPMATVPQDPLFRGPPEATHVSPGSNTPAELQTPQERYQSVGTPADSRGPHQPLPPLNEADFTQAPGTQARGTQAPGTQAPGTQAPGISDPMQPDMQNEKSPEEKAIAQSIYNQVQDGTLPAKDALKAMSDMEYAALARRHTKELHAMDIAGRFSNIQETMRGKEKMAEDKQTSSEKVAVGKGIWQGFLKGGSIFQKGTTTPLTGVSYRDVLEHPELFTSGPIPHYAGGSGGGVKKSDALSPELVEFYANKVANHELYVKDLPNYVSKFRQGDQSMGEIQMRAAQILDERGEPDIDIAASAREAKQFMGSTKAATSTMTFMANIENMQSAIDELQKADPRTPLKALNKYLDNARMQFGDKAVTDVRTLGELLGTELGASLGGGTPAVARDATGKVVINENAPLTGLNAALQKLRQVEVNRIVALMAAAGPQGRMWLEDNFGEEAAHRMLSEGKTNIQKTVAKAAGDEKPLATEHPEADKAREWLKTHPNDPLAPQVRKKLGL